MDDLYRKLHIWAGTPHEWSYCDCYMVLGDWVNVVHGFDPAAELRGTYGDPDVCPIGRGYRADPIPLGEQLLQDLQQVSEASVGDVAFVQSPGARFLCGAIRIKDTKSGRAQWAMKTESIGVQVSRFVRPVRVWGVNYGS